MSVSLYEGSCKSLSSRQVKSALRDALSAAKNEGARPVDLWEYIANIAGKQGVGHDHRIIFRALNELIANRKVAAIERACPISQTPEVRCYLPKYASEIKGWVVTQVRMID